MAREHLHDLARLRRQDLVVHAVTQQQRGRAEQLFRVLASRRLRRERDDTTRERAERDRGLDRDRAAEAVADGDDALRAALDREVGGRREVVHAVGKMVGLAGSRRGSSRCRRSRTGCRGGGRSRRRGRADCPCPPPHRDDHTVGVAGSVPQQREQPAQRVHLDVMERGSDLDLRHRERLEQRERRSRRSRRTVRISAHGAAPCLVEGACDHDCAPRHRS